MGSASSLYRWFMYSQVSLVHLCMQLSYAKCYYFAILTYRYLNYSITKLRKQDTLSVLVYVTQNVHGRYLAWNFARNNWNYISETLSY